MKEVKQSFQQEKENYKAVFFQNGQSAIVKACT